MNAKKHKNQKTKSAGNNNVRNYVETQIKLEYIHSNDTENSQNCQEANYNNQNINITSNCKNIKKESSANPYFRDIINKKQDTDGSSQFDDTLQKMNSSKNFNISSDYDIFKSEIEDTENSQNIDNIKLAHDLDAVIYFNDIKLSSDVSPFVMDNHLQENDDNMMQISINKDPLTDPLFISDQEKNVTPIKLKSEFLKKKTQRKSVRILNKETIKNIHIKQKYKDKKVKHILKKLEDKKKEEEIPLILIQVI